jgi:hypothetical protein
MSASLDQIQFDCVSWNQFEIGAYIGKFPEPLFFAITKTESQIPAVIEATKFRIELSFFGNYGADVLEIRVAQFAQAPP